MRRYDFWKLGLLNVLSTPMRSLLTVLGMAIGVGAILAVLTLGDAGKHQVETEMMRLGIDRVWLTAAEGSELRHGDAAALTQALGEPVTEQVYGGAPVRCGERTAEGMAVGCSADYLAVMNTRLLAGRSLYPLEWRAGSRTALMGRALADELALQPADRITVGGLSFTVAGVVEMSNQLSTLDGSRAVFLPIDVFCELMGPTVAELTVSVPRRASPDAVAQEAVEALSRLRGRSAQAVTMQAQIDAANAVIDIFVHVLQWVAVICMLVGGIGVMNILLVSVRERRREIGVMKSLGASAAQVCGMFLLEALLYAFIGGLDGLAAGFGLIRLAAASIGLQPIVRGGDVLSVVGAAVAVGLFFGVAPALKASAMTPVDALRE